MISIKRFILMLFKGIGISCKKNCGSKYARFASVLCVAIALTPFLCACKDGGAQATQPIATLEPELTEAYEEDLEQPGGELRIYVPRGRVSIDPLLAQAREMRWALSLAFEPLMRYDGKLMLTPSLAESWEPLNASGSLWKISLRRGVKWHGSRGEFTSKDVIFTLDLLKSEEYASSPYAEAVKSIKSYRSLDDYAVEITPEHPGVLAMNAFIFPIVSKNDYARGSAPVGTGPYVIEYADEDYGVQFKANEFWWRTPPYIKSVVARCERSMADALEAVRNDRINYVTTNALTTSQYREGGETGIIEIQTQYSEALLINHRNSILQDIRVRKAIAYALDRRDIISKAYLNHAYVTDVPVSPSSWLYDKDLSGYDYNAEMAKQLLADAGWADMDEDGILDKADAGEFQSFKITLLVNDTPDNQVRKDVANLIKTQLENVGIGVTVDYSVWTEKENYYLEALRSGAFDMALAGFNLDPNSDLTEFLSSGGLKNYGAYISPEMDRLLGNARSAPDSKTMRQALASIQREFLESLPYIHLYFRTSSAIYSEHIGFSGIEHVRENSPYFSIEKWYLNNRGRQLYKPSAQKDDADWSQFATEPGGLPQTSDGVSPTPTITPTGTPNDSQPADQTPISTPKSTPKPTQRPTQKPTQKPTVAPTVEPAENPSTSDQEPDPLIDEEHQMGNEEVEEE